MIPIGAELGLGVGRDLRSGRRLGAARRAGRAVGADEERAGSGEGR